MSEAIDFEELAKKEEERQAEVDGLAKAAAAAIVPTMKRLFIRAEETANPSSTLWTPEMARQYCMTGVVVAAGADTTIKVGSRVILGMFTGVKMEVNKVPHLICKEEQIEGIVVGNVEVLATEQ